MNKYLINIKIHLKRIISNNIIFYYVWFKLVRKRKGLNVNFLHRDTDLYVDGYPRSGNTFIIHLVKNLLPEINVVHHLHVVAPIKTAFLMKVPTFILVRDPMECISSKYLKYFSMRGIDFNNEVNYSLLDMFIADYLNYYDFILRNKNNVSIIYFDELINFPKIIIERIQDQLNIEREITEEVFMNAKASYRGATNTMGSSLPNQAKERYKSVIKDHIVESNKSRDILDLYGSIIDQ